MKLNHDTQGFLVGESVAQPSPEEAKTLSQIASDIRAIKRHLLGDDAGKTDQKPEGIATPVERRVRAATGLVGAPGQKAAQTALAAMSVVATPRRAANDSAKIAAAIDRLTAAQKQNGRTGDSAALPTKALITLPELATQAVATPQIQRDDRGRFIAKSVGPAIAGVAPAAAAVTPKGEVGKVSERDGRGRFTGSDGADDGQESGLSKAMGALGDKLGQLANATGDAGEVDPNIKAASEVGDLAGKALTGVKTVGSATMAVAKPMGRGIKGLFGGKPSDAPTPWFRRFLGEMRLFRREQSAFAKAEIRLLKDIEAKPDADGKGGGIMGMLGALMGLIPALLGGLFAKLVGGLSRIPGLGMLSKLATRGAVLGGAGAAAGATKGAAPTQKPSLWQRAKDKVGGVFGKEPPITSPGAPAGAAVAAKAPGLLSRAASGVGGLLKKVPLLGAALAAIGAGASVYESESSDTLSRAEKDKKTGKAVGGGVGTIGGMMSGAAAGAALGALGGPIGMAIGGVIGGIAGGFFGEKAGAIIGEKVGGWVTDIRNADIPGMIGAAWIKTTAAVLQVWTDSTAWVGKKWDTALAGFNDLWTGAKSVFGDLAAGVNAIFAKFGIDLPAIKEKLAAAAEAAKEAVTNSVQAAGQWASEKAGALKNTVQNGVTTAANAVGEKAGQAKEAFNGSLVGKGVSAVGGKLAGAWGEAKGYLTGASTAAGVDPGIVAKIARFESGYNSDAAPRRKDGTTFSSAHGYGQFLDGTWTDMINRHGSKYGIEGAGKLTTEQAKKYRNDKGIQAAMLAEFTKENISKGRAFGGKDDDANVYALHNLGGGDAKKLLGAVNSSPTMSVRDALLQGAKTDKERARVEAVISGNKSLYGDGSVTVADAYARMGKHMRDGEVFAQDARATSRTQVVAPVGPVASAATVSVSAPPSVVRVPQVTPPAIPRLDSQDGGSAPPPMFNQPRPQPIVVQAPRELAGRDLPNRKIAHIATGGIAS